jgi:hypothetical protein
MVAFLAGPTIASPHIMDSNGMWYFTGSTYNAKTSPPDPDHRADPITILWYGLTNTPVTIDSVVDHIDNEWQDRKLPSWAFPGESMNSRSNPGCTAPQFVFMRDTSVNSGAWSTSSRYMSTNHTCFNQYHTRMWSSHVHAGETGASHDNEWVLAGIHHERWGGGGCSVASFPLPHVRCRKPTHHINMTWDQARRVYLTVMGRQHCVTAEGLINPESQGWRYGRMPPYSGIVSRLSIEHASC